MTEQALQRQAMPQAAVKPTGVGPAAPVCLSGTDTGGAYCLLEVALAPGMSVPRHTHTREDEVYFVLAGEL